MDEEELRIFSDWDWVVRVMCCNAERLGSTCREEARWLALTTASSTWFPLCDDCLTAWVNMKIVRQTKMQGTI